MCQSPPLRAPILSESVSSAHCQDADGSVISEATALALHQVRRRRDTLRRTVSAASQPIATGVRRVSTRSLLPAPSPRTSSGSSSVM